MSYSYDEQRKDEERRKMVEAETEKLRAEAARLKELKEVPTLNLRATRDPISLKVWVTIWFTQILTWGFMMMTFKNNVWPK